MYKVYFYATGHSFDTAAFSSAIGLDPSRTWRQGDQVPKTTIKKSNDGWSIGPSISEGYQIYDGASKLLSILWPVRDKLILSKRMMHLSYQVSFVVEVGESFPALTFPDKIIEQLADIQCSLDIDMYHLA